MDRKRSVRCKLFAVAVFLVAPPALQAAEGIISRIPDAAGAYCQLTFPAIREETLYTDRPALKDPSEGDIIVFYGPCDHDPPGKDEIRRQREDSMRMHRRSYSR